ncbi:hypothetical protein [Escherichia coli]|nr:hypothetical protein [Escherichia coli]
MENEHQYSGARCSGQAAYVAAQNDAPITSGCFT